MPNIDGGLYVVGKSALGINIDKQVLFQDVSIEKLNMYLNLT